MLKIKKDLFYYTSTLCSELIINNDDYVFELPFINHNNRLNCIACSIICNKYAYEIENNESNDYIINNITTYKSICSCYKLNNNCFFNNMNINKLNINSNDIYLIIKDKYLEEVTNNIPLIKTNIIIKNKLFNYKISSERNFNFKENIDFNLSKVKNFYSLNVKKSIFNIFINEENFNNFYELKKILKTLKENKFFENYNFNNNRSMFDYFQIKNIANKNIILNEYLQCFVNCYNIINDKLVLELLNWFKKDFFKWCDYPDCLNCSKIKINYKCVFIEYISPSNEE